MATTTIKAQTHTTTRVASKSQSEASKRVRAEGSRRSVVGVRQGGVTSWCPQLSPMLTCNALSVYCCSVTLHAARRQAGAGQAGKLGEGFQVGGSTGTSSRAGGFSA